MGIDFPKCMLEISGKRLVDICIESLAKDGFRQFVFLLGHMHEHVMQHLGDGSRYGIKISYSIDPINVLGWGKGKALKYALQNNRINRSMRSVVVFPDDIIMENGTYSAFLTKHIKAVRSHGVLASAVLVPGTEYPYGVAKVKSNGIIMNFAEKPFINKPTSTGIYAFEPQVYEILDKRIDFDEPGPVELESVVLPILARKNKLFGFFIPSNKWLPINTMKEYERATKVLIIRN
jgi:NDP-sugar pyrophosphorylase family protein